MPESFSSQKIIRDIDSFLQQLDRTNKSIIFTNGCFDLLHEGHLHLIAESKKLGDKLIVAVNDDASVKRLKGATRPVESLETRMKNLAASETVDYIISKEEVVGNHIAQKTVIIPLLDGFSTTKIIQAK